MKQIIKKEINSESNNILPLGKIKQENNIILELELIKDGKPLMLSNQEILVGGRTSKGKILEQKDGISKSNNKLTVNLKNEFVLDEGILEIDINLKDSDGQMTTSSFFLEVISKTLNKEAIEATDYITSLDLIINNFKTITADEIEKFNKNSKKTIDDFNNISKNQLDNQTKDYQSLKRIIIDENQAAELQAQVTKNREDIDILNDEQPMWSRKEGIGQVNFDNTFNGVAKSSVVYGKTTGGYNVNTGQFDSIESSAESEGNKIIIKSIGKNLIFEKKEGYVLSGADRFIYVKDLEGVCYIAKVSKGTYISSNKNGNRDKLAFFKEYPTTDKIEALISTQRTITVQEDGYVIYYTDYENPTAATNVQLEEGTVASKYEDYIEDKKEILLPCPHREWNTYNGESGKYIEGSVVTIVPNEKIATYTANTENTISFYVHANFLSPTSRTDAIVCDRFRTVTKRTFQGENPDYECCCLDDAPGRGFFFIKILKSRLETQDTEGVKKWLQENPTTVIYELAEPIIHNIEKVRINTYNGTTHFIQDNEIKGNMSFEVAVDRDARIEVNDINIKNNKTEIDICNKAIDINRIDIIKQELITEELNGKSIVFDSEIKSIKQENVNQQTQINRKLETVSWDMINNKPTSFNPTSLNTELLWEGASYVASDHTITPSKPLSNCRTGWMLVFSKYTASTVRDYSFSVVYIRKDTKLTMEDRGVGFLMSSTGENITKFEDIINKYMYINNTSIRGTAGNVTGQNSFSVLRYVYEF